MEIKLCCHYCENKNQIRKHGKSRAGIPRYQCLACKRTFQTRYIYQGNETDIHRLIEKRLADGKSHSNIASQLGIRLDIISRHILAVNKDK